MTATSRSSTTFSTNKCGICFDEKTEKKPLVELHRNKNVAHLFHQSCIGSWLNQNDNCPYCRHILTYEEQYKFVPLNIRIARIPTEIDESAILNIGLKKINSCPPIHGNQCG